MKSQCFPEKLKFLWTVEKNNYMQSFLRKIIRSRNLIVRQIQFLFESDGKNFLDLYISFKYFKSLNL